MSKRKRDPSDPLDYAPFRVLVTLSNGVAGELSWANGVVSGPLADRIGDMTEGEVAGYPCMAWREGKDILSDGLALNVFLHRRCESVKLLDGEWPSPPPIPPGAVS
jgi:hypothetical protein